MSSAVSAPQQRNPTAASARVESATFREAGTALVFVVQLSQPVRFDAIGLDGPTRAVIDLQRTATPVKKDLPAGNAFAAAVRAGPRPGGSARLVLDLAPDVRWRTLTKAGTVVDRIELELTGGTVAANSNASAAPAAITAARDPLKPVDLAHDPGKKARQVVIAVDAGHGGQDSGAIGHGGTYEKNVVLEIARRLAARIDQEPGMRAVLTRDGDYFLTLRQRIKRAREAGAMMFVSVHADSVRDPQVSGSSVYVLSEKGATDEQARWLADRENAADLMGGVSLDDKDPVLASVLVDLTQSAQIGYSMQAAERVLASLREVHEVHRPRVQQAGFVVLKSPDIPSMLVETAFISNASDERKLTDPARQGEIATAIFNGVHRYFVEHPPEGSRFALERAEARRVANAEERRKAGAL
jgi:N-acetylmuramoyl-L-alanine amidase